MLFLRAIFALLQASPGRFVRGDGSVAHYAARRSELVRLIRNLSEHFADQRAEVRAKLISAGGSSEGQSAAAGSSGLAAAAVREQESAVGEFFFALFPRLVLALWAAEARLRHLVRHQGQAW